MNVHSPSLIPGRVRVASHAPTVDDRDLGDEEVVAANIAEDVLVANKDSREAHQARRPPNVSPEHWAL